MKRIFRIAIAALMAFSLILTQYLCVSGTVITKGDLSVEEWIAAAESLVYYLKAMFGTDIRVFVPQIAMSAGTMIALSAKEIVMGKQSNLGPIDPQFNGVSCAGIVEEFKQAQQEIAADPRLAQVWGQIIAKYHPTFVGDCQKAIDWADQMVSAWLADNMLKSEADRANKVSTIVQKLSSHNATFSHSRHIHSDELLQLGVKVTPLETLDSRAIDGCKDLQDCVLTLHHSYMLTLSNTKALKIIESHTGNTMINIHK